MNKCPLDSVNIIKNDFNQTRTKHGHYQRSGIVREITFKHIRIYLYIYSYTFSS